MWVGGHGKQQPFYTWDITGDITQQAVQGHWQGIIDNKYNAKIFLIPSNLISAK
jgi:hypothetical protein